MREENLKPVFQSKEQALQILKSICALKVNRGKYMTGAKPTRDGSRYISKLGVYGNNEVFLGLYYTEYEAHETWRLAKIEYVKEIATYAFEEGHIGKDELDRILSIDFTHKIVTIPTGDV